MTFKKGDPKLKEYQKKGQETKDKQKKDLWEYLASGAARSYQELLEKQLSGEELNKNAEKGMDRCERLFGKVKGNMANEGENIIELRHSQVDEFYKRINLE